MLSKLLRIGEGRMVKRLKGVADYVNTKADEVEKLTDDELRAKTAEFKATAVKVEKAGGDATRDQRDAGAADPGARDGEPARARQEG